MENRREVAEIGLVDGGTVRAKEGETLKVVNEYHGEYDLDWICLFRGETEVRRYNARTLEYIIWRP